MRFLLAILLLLAAAPIPVVDAQLSPPNRAGVSMGHLHYRVRDVEANVEFWVRLGGTRATLGDITVIIFPDILVVLEQGESSGGSEGSVVNHVAFRVQSLDDVAAAGFEFERSSPSSGITSVYSPEGERVELFDNTATNLRFTAQPGIDDPVAQRHNRIVTVPIIAHHIHLYLPEGSEDDARTWYATMFGGTPGMRWRYPATDLPGINFNFSDRPGVTVPTRGRMLDHIGLEVVNLEAFCRRLAEQGIRFDRPWARGDDGVSRAFLTDPWGTSIALTEGLRTAVTP